MWFGKLARRRREGAPLKFFPHLLSQCLTHSQKKGTSASSFATRSANQDRQSHEELKWLRFFDDPSMWWDNRAKHWNISTDFKHVSRRESLWIGSPYCPQWVQLRLKCLEEPSDDPYRDFRAQYREDEGPSGCKVKSNRSIFLAALKECSSSKDLVRGKKIHAAAIESGADSNIYVGNTLVDMYAKCGSMVDARRVFDQMPCHTVVSWNALIMGYAENGQGELALELFARVVPEGCAPNRLTFVAALKACTSLAAKEEGKQVDGQLVKMGSLEKGSAIHSQATSTSCDSDIYVASTLVGMYAKCGSLVNARRVFDKMPYHTVVSWTALMLGYAENGQGELALELFARMQPEGCAPDARTFVAALKACTSMATKEQGKQADGKLVNMRSLEKGLAIHSQAASSGCDSDIYVASTLVDMYAKCGSMVDARRVFDKMPYHTVVSWNALMLGYAENGQGELALELFARMQPEGCAPDARTFVAALKACTSMATKEQGKEADGKLVSMRSLEKGLVIHSQAASSGCESDIYVASTLVDMYAKCGSVVDARRVFDKMPCHTVVSWNALMLGYVENGQGEVALELLARLQREGCVVNRLTFVAAVQACTSLAMKEEGKEVDGKLVKMASLAKGLAVHSQAATSGFESDIYVGNTLVDMYAKCGSVVDAHRVFDQMPCHTVVSWNALILGYADNRQGELALELLAIMRPAGCAPDARTFVAALKACSSMAVKEEGKQVDGKLVKMASLEKGLAVHSEALSSGCDADIYVASTLVDMYVKCGSLVDARRVFDKMPCHNVVSWNAMMLGYAENGQGELALDLFARMRREGCAPDARTFVAALQACTSLAVKEEGQQVDGKFVKTVSLEKGLVVHSEVASSGCDLDIYVGNTLLDMYAKCGSMVDACRVFDKMPCHTVVSWTALMLGYADNGEGESALELFARMQLEGCTPNARTFVAALQACASLAVKEEGKQVDGKLVKMASLEKGLAVHSQAASSGCDADVYVANTLVDMYAKCGRMLDARRVFDKMLSHTVVSWTALMLGYADNGQGELALELFARMQHEGCAPDARTLVAALKACSMVVGLEIGKAIHEDIGCGVLENDAVLANALVDFYGKCGSMVDAQQVFDSLATKDLVSWTALIAGYGRQGDTKRVFDLFHMMQDKGLQANGVTFLCILTACSHAGLVDKGKEYFEAMSSKYGIDPSIEHYVCMVDIFGRAKQLDDAVAMVKSMPFEADAVTWRTVLGACRKWNNVVVGRLAFESLLRLDEKDGTAYVLMANIYGSVGMWEEQSKVEGMRVKARAWKKPGQSWWIDQAGVVHTFVVGDPSHSQSEHLHSKLRRG